MAKHDHKNMNYNNTDIELDQVITELIADEGNLQLLKLIRRLSDDDHSLAGVVREIEVIRYYVSESKKRLAAVATCALYIAEQTKVE
ncbi:hypothetical protein NJH77_21275 [Serratia fonticola]|uniref:hypothetical protein n=1 Tax=Serratia fonticola TaxID=47917 RepID=UPI002096C58C|nr:hypothetical protein [Serratia fonticola]MCO7511785.1 hypothetical protein [Serratia fonticola]